MNVTGYNKKHLLISLHNEICSSHKEYLAQVFIWINIPPPVLAQWNLRSSTSRLSAYKIDPHVDAN